MTRQKGIMIADKKTAIQKKSGGYVRLIFRDVKPDPVILHRTR